MTRLKVYNELPSSLSQRELSFYDNKLIAYSRDGIKIREIDLEQNSFYGENKLDQEIKEILLRNSSRMYITDSTGYYDEFCQVFLIGDNIQRRYEGWSEENSPFKEILSGLKKDGSVQLLDGYSPSSNLQIISKKMVDDKKQTNGVLKSNPILSDSYQATLIGEPLTVDSQYWLIKLPKTPGPSGTVWDNNGVITLA